MTETADSHNLLYFQIWKSQRKIEIQAPKTDKSKSVYVL